jgi:hypothetical protein
MEAKRLAEVWKHNRKSFEDWASDYESRMHTSREDTVAEVQAHWIHDERASVVGTFDGYKLSVCPAADGAYRYTVVTPWGTNEGLCDLDHADNYRAIGLLREVVENM